MGCGPSGTTTPVLLTLPPLNVSASPSPTLDSTLTTPAGTLEPVTPSPPALVTPDPDAAVAAAVAALSLELGVPVEQIVFISSVPTQWRDASLGCPEPGQTYPELIIEGYLITLAVEAETYTVHTDWAGTAIVCFDGGADAGGGGDPLVAEFIAQAKAELAARLGISIGEIALVRSEAVEWSNSSLGCAVQGETYVEVPTPGYRIILADGQDRYEYHTDLFRMILCEQPTQ